MSEGRLPIVHYDLDQTLQLLIGPQAQAYSKLLNLDLPQSRIDELARLERDCDSQRIRRTFTKTGAGDFLLFGDPSLRFSPDVFEPIRATIRGPELLRTADPFPGAVEGVKILDTVFGTKAYRTVRPNTEEVMAATINWLNQHEFPQAPVLIYADPYRKLEHMLQEGNSVNHPLGILIDDGIGPLVKAATTLSTLEENREALKRMVIVGFATNKDDLTGIKGGSIYPDKGLHVLHHDTGIRIVTLPSWQLNNVGRLVDLLGKFQANSNL